MTLGLADPAQPRLHIPQQDTMYDILQEVRSSLNSDVSRVVDELSQKADRHNEAIGELLGRLTLDYGEDLRGYGCLRHVRNYVEPKC